MQHPHRPRQRHVAGPHDDHLAAHAAQVGQFVTRGQTAAIDDEVRAGLGGLHVDSEPDRYAARRETGRERRQRLARFEMGLVGKEQRTAEAAGEIGFERGDSVGVEPFVALGPGGKACEVGGVARRRQHEAALRDGAGKMLAPPIDRRLAQPGDDLIGGRPFAPGRQHAARHPRAGTFAEMGGTLQHLDGHATRGKLRRTGKACDAGSDDCYDRSIQR